MNRAGLKRRLGKRNVQRLQILRKTAGELAATFREPSGHPVPVERLRAELAAMPIGPGDTLLVHSSIGNLSRALPRREGTQIGGPVEYAQAILELLLDLVGEEGTLLMPTDSLRGFFGFSHRGDVFDYRTMPSRRGLLTELFRQLPGTRRSIHPHYNLSARGPRAEAMLAGHADSVPYTMDVHSPWYALHRDGGKVLFLGLDFEINSTVHLCEYLHPEEYPRPLYFDKPVPIKSRTWDGDVKTMGLKLHAVQLPDWALPPFCGGYLQEKYGIYTIRPLGWTQLVCFTAQEQYDAVYAEMQQDVCWYDARYWPGVEKPTVAKGHGAG